MPHPSSTRRLTSALGLVALTLSAAACASTEAKNESLASDVDSWTVDAVLVDCDAPDVDPLTCTGKGKTESYTSLSADEVTEPWEVCATVPSLQDPVWIGINYGMVQEAERLGVKLTFSDAGGYENIAEQNSQVEDCVAQNVDAIVIGAVSADALGPAISSAKKAGIPVIDGGNGISSKDVTARAVLDYYDMGHSIGTALVDQGEAMKVALMPGPAGVGWSERSVVGFKDATAGSDIELLETKYGDPVKEVQVGLVEDVLSAHPDIDAIVGTGVTVDVGAGVLAERGLDKQVGLYSTYISPSIIDLLEEGKASCAPNDQGVMLARTMLDLAVRSVEDAPFVGDAHRAAPSPVVVCGPAVPDHDNIDDFDPKTAFAPDGWTPVSRVG